MIVRRILLVLPAVTGFLLALPAQAEHGSLTRARDAMCADWYERKFWPDLYVPADRAATCAPFPLMISNGWRAQTTLLDHHFIADSGQLSEAGRMKVRWIATEVPPERRTIFVFRAETTKETATRVQAAKLYAMTVAPAGESAPAVVESAIRPLPMRGDEVDAVNRQFQSSVPAPRLPAADWSSGGSSSSGGSGGSSGGTGSK
jgi:hypothetical protein